jgi:aspartate/methionine/tyrosine aminotransferase
MKVSSRIYNMIDAPVDRINRERLRLESEDISILNLGQAIPNFPPPEIAKQKSLEYFSKQDVHVYTPDPGIPQLRRAIAESLRESYGVTDAHPDEIIITAGANHAFLLVCSLIIDEKDCVGLLSPFFLNHKMAVEGCGGTVIEIMPDDNFNYSYGAITKAIEKYALRAIVIVNPSNPTGKVFTRDELEMLLRICKENEIWIICDEVYRNFVYEPTLMVSLNSLAGSSEQSMIIGSFSKEFGMTGWRVGWLKYPKSVISNLLKIQDYSIICSPHFSQIFALKSLEYAPNWTGSHLNDFLKRKKELVDLLKNSGLFQVYDGNGAFFIWFRPGFEVDSDNEVFNLMRTEGVCMMPGIIFGEEWRSWFRISYGSQPLEQIREAVNRIIRYFKHHKVVK